MDKNEKAATRLGWKPGIKAVRRHFGIKEVWFIETDQEHPSAEAVDWPAPDMSRPENYMPALEGLPRDFCWILTRDSEGFTHCSISGIASGPRHGNGATPREALAALYDAEHPEEAWQSRQKSTSVGGYR